MPFSGPALLLVSVWGGGGVEKGGHRCQWGQVMKDLQFRDLKFRFNPVENSDCILKITAEEFHTVE